MDKGGGMASPFFSPAFLNAFRVYGDLHPYTYAEGHLYGIQRNRLGWTLISCLPYGHPGGPLPEDPILNLDSWIEDLRKDVPRIGRVEVVDRFQRAVSPQIFRQVILVEHVIPMEDSWKAQERRMRKSLREQVRQSIRKGVHVRPLQDQDLPAFWNLIAQTYKKRHGIVPPSPSFLSKIWHLRPHTLLALGAFVKGRLASGLWILTGSGEWFAYLQGTDPAMYAYRVSPRLFFEALRYAHTAGVPLFSMGGTPPGNTRLAFFKESLGAQAYPYPIWIYEHPLFGTIRRLYRSVKSRLGHAEMEIEGIPSPGEGSNHRGKSKRSA